MGRCFAVVCSVFLVVTIAGEVRAEDPSSVCFFPSSGMGLEADENERIRTFLKRVLGEVGALVLTAQDKPCLPGAKMDSDEGGAQRLLGLYPSHLRMASILKLKLELRSLATKQAMWGQEWQLDVGSGAIDGQVLRVELEETLRAEFRRLVGGPQQTSEDVFRTAQPSQGKPKPGDKDQEKPEQTEQEAKELVDVRLNSIPPGAAVYLNNKKQGITNLMAKLRPGKYKLTLHKEQYEDFALSLVVQPKRAQNIELKLTPRLNTQQRTLKIVRWSLVGTTVVSSVLWGVFAFQANAKYNEIRRGFYENSTMVLSTEGASHGRNAKVSALSTAVSAVTTAIFWLALEF